MIVPKKCICSINCQCARIIEAGISNRSSCFLCFCLYSLKSSLQQQALIARNGAISIYSSRVRNSCARQQGFCVIMVTRDATRNRVSQRGTGGNSHTEMPAVGTQPVIQA